MSDGPQRSLDDALQRGGPKETVAEDLAMARLRGALFGRRSDPRRIGRYRVEDRLGSGGHGIVYAAFDERLDRKVALKVLRPDVTHPRAKDRLLREAQALARLAHPNIVTVYEVFEDDEGEVVVAMEFIEGPSLEAWIEQTDATFSEILAVYRQAGEGLAAAHGVGVVHRDFKPANAIVGQQTGSGASPDAAVRVRVLDFGLARLGASTDARSSPDDPAPPGLSGGASGDHTLPEHTEDSARPAGGAATAATGIVGTPRYMPPEQHRGRPADERSDQYSFCVALFEALHNRPPFDGADMRELYRAKMSGTPARPADTAVPSRICRAIERGLHPDPQERHPSMRALLDALAHDPKAARRRWATGLAIVGAAGVGALYADGSTDDPCVDAAQGLARVWHAGRAEEVESVFARTEAPYAAQAWASTSASIEAWAEAWSQAKIDACVSHARGEQSAESLDLRSACLQRRLSHLEALLQVLESADADVVAESTRAASHLPSVESCSNIVALRAVTPPPDDPQQAARVDELREQLALGRANAEAGRFESALQLAEATLADAAAQYEPLQAEALLLAGDAASMSGHSDAAIEHLHRAGLTATRVGDDALFGSVAASLAWEHGEAGDDYDLAHTWIDLGQAALHRIGGDPSVAARLHNARGAVLFNQGRFDDALAEHRTRLALVGEDTYAAHGSLINIGNVHNARGEFETARTFYERAASVLERELGPKHPRVLLLRGNTLGIRWRTEPLERSAAEGRALLALQEEVFGSDHPSLATTLGNLALIENLRHRRSEAERYARRSVELLEAAYGSDSRFLLAPAGQLAQSLGAQGRADEARALAERALAIATAGPSQLEVAHTRQTLAQLAQQADDLEAMRRHLQAMKTAAVAAGGEQHPLAAVADSMLADLARSQGRLDEAQKLADAAAAILQAAGPSYRLDAAIASHYRGEILVERQLADEAVPVLEHALAELTDLDIGGDRRARTLFALARALHDSGRPGPARSRAAQAVELAEDPDLRAAIDAWSAKAR